jgi:excisionase family DNA binding protein
MSETVLISPAVSTDRHPVSDSEILTVLEVARFLRVPKSTVYKLARLGVLPASKIGKHWRFLRRDIQGWMQRGSHQTV